VLAVILSGLPQGAYAQRSISFIRDAEIEDTIRQWATPLFTAAGLDPSAIRIYLVNDPRLNAFVAGGQNLFIHTGTLMRSESANQVIGVMAHETGHIAGGHLARTQEVLRNATIESVIAMVLGAGAAAMSRGSAGGAGGAVMSGGAALGQRTMLAYSVQQEASADQAGMTFLDRTGQSAKGLYDFFKILEGQELLSAQMQDPYLRTHPLTRDRMNAVEEHLRHSKFSDVKDPPEFVEQHARMKAKLAGFINPPGQTLATYKDSDNSVAARYARAVALYRIPDLNRAVPLIEGLIREEPKNPYFQELYGQMLFENGKIRDAVPHYQEAVRLAPKAALLRIELAQAETETNDPALNKQALANLTEAQRAEDRNAELWRLMAVAYGRDDNLGMSALSLAEQAMVQGDKRQAIQQAIRASRLLPVGTPGRMRAEDLKEAAKRLEEPERE
jgi:predicted Zn-dependent protease